MSCFDYYKNKIKNQDLNHLIFLMPNNIQSKCELISLFQSELKFPYYFGENLDALYDCLVDLGWIKEKKILIIHNDIPLDHSELETAKYLAVLSDAAMFWENNDRHDLEILFPEKFKDKIERMLKD